jgi:hypothetical protein
MSSKPFCQFARASQQKGLELVRVLDQCNQQSDAAKEINLEAGKRLHACSFFPELLALPGVTLEEGPKLAALLESYKQAQSQRLEQGRAQLAAAEATVDALADELRKHDAVVSAIMTFECHNDFYPEVDPDLPEPGQLDSGFREYLALVQRELEETTALIQASSPDKFDTHAFNWARTTIQFEGGVPDVAESLDELLASRLMLRALRRELAQSGS